MHKRSNVTASASLVLMLALAGCATSPVAHAPSATADNARTSLDWAGTYYGVLPCADCSGIATTVTLATDGSYRTALRYLGTATVRLDTAGRFTWNAAGSTVTLDGSDPALYFVAENRLVRLGADGSRVTGALASHYVLTKGPLPLAATRWELLSLGDGTIAARSATPFLVLGADHRVHGSDGCNNLMGSYALGHAAGQLRFGELAAARRFCAGAMETAQALAEALRNTRSYAIDGGALALRDARGATVARFIAVPADGSPGD